MRSSVCKRLKTKLLCWFEKHKRALPWRQTKDPYAIWISEVMLQQTTSQAVIPYYQKFLKKFPRLSVLAKADKTEMYSLWAGLGYYKRAENLLKAAVKLNKIKSFPQTYRQLLKFPGFGPYIARAVSSLAFEEPVGVLDGNVIRFLSRFHALPLKHWLPSDRIQLQCVSDLWVQNQKSSRMNQALMEIGSVICRSKNPLCRLCPVMPDCLAHQQGLEHELPLKKPQKAKEFWHWKPERIQKSSRWAFVKNINMPFLKGCFVFPGTAKQLNSKAKRYDFMHSIMHYQIFVTIQNKSQSQHKMLKWLTASQITKNNPSSLIQKILDY